MARKKSCPTRSRGIFDKPSSNNNCYESNRNNANCEQNGLGNGRESLENTQPFHVEVSSISSNTENYCNIAEIVLDVISFANEETQAQFCGEHLESINSYLRFSLYGVDENSFRLGHWPVLPSDSIVLENKVECTNSREDKLILFSGIFDGPDEAISGLVHLVSLKFVTLSIGFEKPLLGHSVKLIVSVTSNAFEASRSLLENARQPWRKSMMRLMSWIRPEVVTSESIYNLNRSEVKLYDEVIEHKTNVDSRENGKHTVFGTTNFYESIKPSKDEPMLDCQLPDLLPHLRPYQSRAAYWMVQREKNAVDLQVKRTQTPLIGPFSIPITSLEGTHELFYNPFNGSISVNRDFCASYVSGGILADEMGLGKTVELLACIFAHRIQSLEDNIFLEDETELIKCRSKRHTEERVQCICGATSESSRYRGMWVQCDTCDIWQHADCVGYKPTMKANIHNRKRSTNSEITESEDSFNCSLCLEHGPKTRTTATLIVCPAPILAQWHSEIILHTRPGSLKICIYEGARNISTSIMLRNVMKDLKNADVVLATYDVLKEDLSHDSDQNDRVMRYKKEYPVIPTVLTRIHWWRVCLDEAQMVECNSSSVTEMAMRLSSVHRWCITGTPIQRRIDDLYGLLKFLRAAPFDIQRWWVDVMRDPYERKDSVAMEFVHRFFKQIMWRSSKAQVSEELQLPLQEECLSWLTFSPVEEHFYQKQHGMCMSYAHTILERYKDNVSQRQSSATSCSNSLSYNTMDTFLLPLLKLRQACCHPQVGSSGLCALQKSPLTMDEILEVLISKTKVEGEEALRIIVVALNGLAGIAIIEQDNNQAISLYKEALTLADENHNNFRLDPLLSIHILYNLSKLLPAATECSPQCIGSSENDRRKYPGDSSRFGQYYTKRRKVVDSNNSEEFLRCYSDGCLKKTCENIKQKYLGSFVSKLSMAQHEFKNSYTQVQSIIKDCENQNMCWWLHVIDAAEENNESHELLKKIDLAVSSVADNSRPVKFSSRTQNMDGLKYMIQKNLDSLELSRKTVIERIMEIDQTMENPKGSDIESKQYCPNCNHGNGSLCVNCELDQPFQVYEAGLFLVKNSKGNTVIASEDAVEMLKQKTILIQIFRDNVMTDKTGNNKGKQRNVKNIQVSKSPSPLEITLKVLKSFSANVLGRQDVASARKHLLLFEAMRKEYAQARSLSIAQSQYLGAHDEIRMSTTRVHLKEGDEQPTSIATLSREEIHSHSLQYNSDKLLSLNKLAHINGQLRYLKGLAVSNQNVQSKQLQAPSKSQEAVDSSNTSLTIEQSESSLSAVEEPCPVCHENIFETKMVFPCGHVLCCKCCLKMTERAKFECGKCQHKWITCPTCRQQADTESIAYVNEKKNCESLTLPNAFQSEQYDNSISISGSYGTKIEAIIRRILWLTSADQDVKILVFSSWNDVLGVLSHSLAANNITYIRMKGGRKASSAVSKFRGLNSYLLNDSKKEQSPKAKPINVLLMLLQHGANGLNLLEAQHVILVEPVLNPASEAQAISRVHRVGQEKQTFVHRFIVKNSVEESIHKLNRSRNISSTISTKSAKKNEPILTIEDLESLFPINDPSDLYSKQNTHAETVSSRLPPAVAAGLAAERRFMQTHHNSSNQ